MKTADELGIETRELDALIAIRAMLASGTIKHHHELPDDFEGNAFDMSYEAVDNGCGSVCCIGGWMSAQMQGAFETQDMAFDRWKATEFVDSATGGLGELFFPPDSSNWDKITNELAVKAIDNFLETGKPDWASVMEHAR